MVHTMEAHPASKGMHNEHILFVATANEADVSTCLGMGKAVMIWT